MCISISIYSDSKQKTKWFQLNGRNRLSNSGHSNKLSMYALLNCYHTQIPGQRHIFSRSICNSKMSHLHSKNKLKHLNQFTSLYSGIMHKTLTTRHGRSFHWEYQFTKLLVSMTACHMHTCEAMYIAAAATEIGERPGTMSSSTAFRAMCVAARWTMLGRPVSKWQQETLN